jgi:outer membrane protein assembly factor BamB
VHIRSSWRTISPRLNRSVAPRIIDFPMTRSHPAVMKDERREFLSGETSGRLNVPTSFSFDCLIKKAPLVAAIYVTFGWTAAGADWPEFRGPSGDGHASALSDSKPRGLPVRWSETNNIKWKTEDGHDFFAICVDADTGKIRFNEKVFHNDNPEPLGNGGSMNCYATPSPAIEPGRVYVHFGSLGTACLDTQTGKVLWKRDDLPCRHYRGASSSVVLFENLVILTMDGADVQYHVALDKQTGKTIWKTPRSVAWNDENVPGQMARDGDLRKAHSTPLIVSTAGTAMMLSPGAKAAYGYDPRTGRELWKVQYYDWSVAPRPLFNRGVAFFVTGLTKTELWAVKTDGEGDVTDTKVLWKLKTHIGKYASPILVGDLIYTAAAESFLTCIEAATGQVVWTERIGGKYAASPIYADGRL